MYIIIKQTKRFNLIQTHIHVHIGKTKKRCGTCLGCTNTDCGSCKYCRDIPKYGGPRRLKQCCEKKKCLDHQVTGIACS